VVLLEVLLVTLSSLLFGTNKVTLASMQQEEDKVTRLSRWEEKWARKQTNWHEDGFHPVLEKYLLKHPSSSLAAATTEGSNSNNNNEESFTGADPPPRISPLRALFPLCGKSVDMEILANRGYDVVGVDGCPDALTTFMKERGEGCAIITNEQQQQQQLSTVKLPSSSSMGYFVGDFIGVTPHDLGGTFDFVFDRGSLVALIPEDRKAYVNTLANLVTAATGTILLVCVEHGPFSNGKLGPPYSITNDDVTTLFGDTFSIELLEREDRITIEPVWKERGCEEFYETTYRLKRKWHDLDLACPGSF